MWTCAKEYILAVLPLLPLVEEDTVEGGMLSVVVVVVVVAILVDTEAIDHELEEETRSV